MLIKMKLFVALLLAGCMQVYANGFSQSVTLSEHNAPLESIFEKIEKQTGFHFWYENELLKQAKKVTIVVKDISLEEVLDHCLKNQSLSYTIIEKTVVIKKKTKRRTTTIDTSVSIKEETAAQIRGRVTAENGQPVAGVTVQEKGTSTAVVTDADGRFSINVADNATLVFSSIGYATQEVSISGRTEINIVLAGEARSLNEVV